MENINSNEVSKMKGAMFALCEITQMCQYNYSDEFNYSLDNKKQALNSVIMYFEAPVRNIITNLAATYTTADMRDFNDPTHQNAAELLLQGFNFVRHSSKVDIPEYFLKNEEALTIWLNIFKAVINKPLFEKEGAGFTDALAKGDTWWKIKSSVAKIVWNMLMKITNKKDNNYILPIAEK